MFVLGLLILAAAVVLAVEFVIANDSSITFSLWNQSWTMDAFWLGVMGAGFLLAVVLAFMLMRGAMARSLRMRSERRELAAENERLAARAKHAAPTPVARKDYPAPPPAPTTAPASTPATAPPAYPAAPPAHGTTDDGRQVAYAGTAPAPAQTEDGGKHHRFFSRHR